jgi:transposase
MGNLAAHKVAGLSAAIAAAGARGLHLPPDNPDRNPIEQVFAKLSRSSPSSKACSAARTVAALRRVIGQPLDASSPKNAPTTSPTPVCSV